MITITFEDIYFLLGATCFSALLIGGLLVALLVIVRLVQHETRLRDQRQPQEKQPWT